MERNLRHSAEGSTWTKKNHKYIRKEGNRYIYPEDVASNLRRTTATNSQGSAVSNQDQARKLSESRAKMRKAAGNTGATVHNQQEAMRLSETRAKQRHAMNAHGTNSTYRNTSKPEIRTNPKTQQKENAFRSQESGFKTSDYARKTSETRAKQAVESKRKSDAYKVHNQEFAKRMTDLQATKRAYKESGGKPLNKVDVYPNGAYNADRKKSTIHFTPQAPGTDSPQQLAKYKTEQNRRSAKAGNTSKSQQRYDDRGFVKKSSDMSHYSQEEAKAKTDDRRREGRMSPRNVHRPGSSEIHDERGFKKDQNQYYDEKGVRRSSNQKYDTQYDDKGVRKSHSTLRYEDGDKPEKSKNFFERRKEASEARKWDKEKSAIKKENAKELKQRQKDAEKKAKEERKAKEKELAPEMRRKLQYKRGKKAVDKFLTKLVNGKQT